MPNQLRTCVACRKISDKKDMIRIALDKSGEAVVDPKGTHEGRGAYVCRNAECITGCTGRRCLDRSFRKKISDECYAEAEVKLTELIKQDESHNRR